MEKEYDLNRFVKAQELSYSWALKEIRNGRKQTHWMWFIFPQLKSLGRSSTALYYGIEDLGEAKAYLTHPILGARLREISGVLLSLDTSDPHAVMGYPDDRKLRSSMTLFARATEDNRVFLDVIEKFYNGAEDGYTLALLDREN